MNSQFYLGKTVARFLFVIKLYKDKITSSLTVLMQPGIFKEKTVIITGAGQGIGFEIARQLSLQGLRLC